MRKFLGVFLTALYLAALAIIPMPARAYVEKIHLYNDTNDWIWVTPRRNKEWPWSKGNITAYCVAPHVHDKRAQTGVSTVLIEVTKGPNCAHPLLWTREVWPNYDTMKLTTFAIRISNWDPCRTHSCPHPWPYNYGLWGEGP